MESEIDIKRNVFRASLRKEYIESYQKKVRMRHRLQELSEQNKSSFWRGEEVVANLEAMLMLTS